jgi:IS5 family transposase
VLAADEQAQVIVAQHVTPLRPEVHELLPAAETIERLLGKCPAQIVADAGYRSKQNVERLKEKSTDPYAARGRVKMIALT